MGINIPTRKELVANRMDNVELARHVGADSLAYISLEGLTEAVRRGMKNPTSSSVGHCTACLSGEYPTDLPQDLTW